MNLTCYKPRGHCRWMCRQTCYIGIDTSRMSDRSRPFTQIGKIATSVWPLCSHPSHSITALPTPHRFWKQSSNNVSIKKHHNLCQRLTNERGTSALRVAIGVNEWGWPSTKVLLNGLKEKERTGEKVLLTFIPWWYKRDLGVCDVESGIKNISQGVVGLAAYMSSCIATIEGGGDAQMLVSISKVK